MLQMTAELVSKYFPQNEYDQALQKNKPVGSVINIFTKNVQNILYSKIFVPIFYANLPLPSSVPVFI